MIVVRGRRSYGGKRKAYSMLFIDSFFQWAQSQCPVTRSTVAMASSCFLNARVVCNRMLLSHDLSIDETVCVTEILSEGPL